MLVKKRTANWVKFMRPKSYLQRDRGYLRCT
jgi:hypothetical protein